MKISAKDSGAALAKTPCLAILVAEGKRPELPDGIELPKGARSFRGEAREVRATDPTSGPVERVLLVGVGKDPDAEALRRVGAVAAKAAEGARVKNLAVLCPASVATGAGDEVAGQALAEGAAMGSYVYDACKSKKKDRELRAVALHGPGKDFARGVRRGKALAAANAFARDLQNAPANLLTPRKLAGEARKIARGSERISCRVLDEAAMGKLGMGSLLGVSRGSSEPAQLIHLTYKPKGRARGGKVCLIGKGLTFDAGGISLKPPAKMDEMKYDMSGSAAVLGAFHALASLDVGCEVHGIVGASENMPDGKATKPGDVHTAMDGTTIEVLNTDAEGRLVLADAICYAKRKVKPDTMIDLATLTGAVVVALGHELSGMFASTDSLRDDLTSAGEAVGEPVWPLPLLDFHRDQMKGKVADLRNINSGEGNGSTAGAAFLRHFAGDTEWCHLDIAGTAWGARDRDWVGGAQGTGVGARLLWQYLFARGS